MAGLFVCKFFSYSVKGGKEQWPHSNELIEFIVHPVKYWLQVIPILFFNLQQAKDVSFYLWFYNADTILVPL